jgi:hypothetical protein
MTSGLLAKGLASALLALTLLAPSPPARREARPVQPVKPLASPADQGATTVDDQVDLALTIYNSNLALVRDVRQLSLPAGTFSLRFMDVAATINPTTVHLRSLSDPAGLAVLEQNYEYDLLEPDKLLRKYVGRKITLVRDRVENGTTKTEEIDALLLAYNNGPVWKIGNEIVTGIRVDQFRFPELPGNLFSRPTLVWMLDNAGAQQQKIEAAYLAGNLSWNADYVLTVGRDDRDAGLGGWVTVTNNSGTAFRNARLQLIAGDIHRTPDQLRREADMVRESMAKAASAPAFAREAFSEYHLYTLQRRTSVNDKQTKQIAFLTSERVPVEKRFVVEGQQFYYHNRQHPGSPIKDLVKVYYRFKNEERSGLGMPMPAGTVRVYQADSKGSVQFAGEDRIDHTPKDETLNIYTGNAFDVVCERKQVDFKVLSSDVYEMEFEITLRNHKDSPIAVDVNEPIGGDWQMLSSSHRWTKTEAWAVSFNVPVQRDGSAVVRYRIRARW